MAGSMKEIKLRIKSVESTMQITKAMELVASSKLRRAKERVEHSRPYFETLYATLFDIAAADSEFSSPYLAKRDTHRRLYIIIAGDRGLAGGFNSNVLRSVEKTIRAKKAQGVEVDVIACGKKAGGFFKFRGVEPVLSFKDLSADPTFEEASQISDYAVKAYEEGSVDEVVLVYNHCLNAASQELRQDVILPVDTAAVLAAAEEEPAKTDEVSASVDFEPEPADVLARLLPAYLRTSIYHALIDSAAGEQAARRMAMHSATENATEMVETLSRLYNRVRQGAITTEITEIVGGAAALED